MESKLMTTSEPTTGEIVRALRCDGDANNCVDCRYATYDTATILCDQEQNVRDAADRLESQEREIERLKEELEQMEESATVLHAANKTHWTYIKELTDRAEKAERERDSIEKNLARRIMKHLSDNELDSTYVCEICEYNLMNSPKCLSCGSDHHYGENFELKRTLRGLLPQDGGKRE